MATFAMPLFTTIARARPAPTRSRHHSTGAPTTVDFVKTPATVASGVAHQQRQVEGVVLDAAVDAGGSKAGNGGRAVDPGAAGGAHAAPWHFLYFLPLPQGHGSLRPTFSTDPPEAPGCPCADGAAVAAEPPVASFRAFAAGGA